MREETGHDNTGEQPQRILELKRPAAADDDAQPSGQFRCRACHTTWDGGQLLRSPYHHDRTTWVCPDTTCGAMVDKC